MIAPDIREINSKDHWACPHCGKSHPLFDDNGQDLRPTTKNCNRCACPMDKEQAVEFGNRLAAEARDPALAAAGAKIRGEVSTIVAEGESRVSADPKLYEQLGDLAKAVTTLTDNLATMQEAILNLQLAQESGEEDAEPAKAKTK